MQQLHRATSVSGQSTRLSRPSRPSPPLSHVLVRQAARLFFVDWWYGDMVCAHSSNACESFFPPMGGSSAGWLLLYVPQSSPTPWIRKDEEKPDTSTDTALHLHEPFPFYDMALYGVYRGDAMRCDGSLCNHTPHALPPDKSEAK